jgi:hypothetical protein
MKNIHERSDRDFIRSTKDLIRHTALIKAEERGKKDAEEGKAGWECPFVGTNHEETEKVRAWYRGYYEIKGIKPKN